MQTNRRQFLKSAAATVGLGAFQPAHLLDSTEETPGTFDFVFFTDTHIQPELNAALGCDMCFRKIAGLNSEFAIMGGDHLFDAFAVSRRRATRIFDLYQETEQILLTKLYHTIGNHDLFGISTKSGASPTDSDYGKKLYEDRMGKKTYYSFGHKGVHFFVLDSVQPTEDRMWEARIDDAQLEWLAEDLQQVGRTAPVVGVTHVPVVTAFESYVELVTRDKKYNTLTVTNASQVLKALEGYNVIGVLQGHTHINEMVRYKNTQFLTSGAVCGNWWHGERMGVPEGFTVVSVKEGTISTRYETYGFKSVDSSEKF